MNSHSTSAKVSRRAWRLILQRTLRRRVGAFRHCDPPRLIWRHYVCIILINQPMAPTSLQVFKAFHPACDNWLADVPAKTERHCRDKTVHSVTTALRHELEGNKPSPRANNSGRGRTHSFRPSRMRVLHPTGKSVKTCPAPSRKIFRLSRRANQRYQLAPSFPGKRGGRASSRTREGMRWTQQRRRETVSQGESLVSGQPARATNGAFSVRQDRVVLTPVAGVKSAEVLVSPPGRDKTFNPPMTVTRRIRRRGEHGISRKTIAQGMPECLR